MRKLFLTFGLLIASVKFALPIWGIESNYCIIQLACEASGIYTEKDRPRMPVSIPQVGQDNHTLYFPDEMGYFVNLYTLGEDGEKTLEYATSVSGDSVQLPSDLHGTYVIEVIRGEHHFWGEIELD